MKKKNSIKKDNNFHRYSINERIVEVKMCIILCAKNIISGEKVKIFANYYNRND